jgi:selenocysteine lyase/cysteine desulfurase
MEAVRHAAEGRASMPPPTSGQSGTPRTLFAELINAKPSEVAYVSSTSAGENLVVQALEIDRRFDGNVVTDGLHFEGALLHLLELKKRGLDVRVAKPTKDFRIDIRDLEKFIDRRTRLVEVSSASMYNGFQHDLKAVCDLAHANGAYVYADIIHSAGAEPFDVKASGVDFAACSSFKWLMGDFGIGFLYAKEALLERIARPVMGYYQAPNLEPFYPPNLPSGEYTPVAYTLQKSATGFFESGTLTGGPAINVALLTASLNYIKSVGVGNIQAHRQPLIRKLQQEVPRLGFTAVTPPGSTGPIVTFAKQNLAQTEIPRRLQAARVNVRTSTHWMRLSPSLYNDMSDIDRFLEVLS